MARRDLEFAATDRLYKDPNTTMSVPQNVSNAKQPPVVYHPSTLSAAAVFAIAAGSCFLLFVAIVYLRRATNRLDAVVAHNAKPPRIRLEPSAVASLPTFTYCAADRRASSDRCAVCLSAMVDGDLMRLLPACRHEFHVKCINTWLLACATCPVCRSEVRPAGESYAGQSTEAPLPTPQALSV